MQNGRRTVIFLSVLRMKKCKAAYFIVLFYFLILLSFIYEEVHYSIFGFLIKEDFWYTSYISGFTSSNISNALIFFENFN